MAAAACVLAQSATHKQGVTLYQQKNYAEAVTTLESAVKDEKPDSAEYRESVLIIGQSLFMMNQGPKAIPWLEKVGPSNEANFMLGYAYLLSREPDKSEAAFARLFSQKPDSAGGHLVAGQMLLKREYEKEAEDEVRKALALDPRIPEAHFILGELAIYHGQPEVGLVEMTKELELNPNFFKAWYRRGDAYTRQENWDAAIPDLQRAIWLNQTYSGPYILLGKCYFKMKNYSNAEGTLRRALALDPQNYSGTYLLAQTLMAIDKKDEARALLEKLKTMERDR